MNYHVIAQSPLPVINDLKEKQQKKQAIIGRKQIK